MKASIGARTGDMGEFRRKDWIAELSNLQAEKLVIENHGVIHGLRSWAAGPATGGANSTKVVASQQTV
jgi:hypothetical protein